MKIEQLINELQIIDKMDKNNRIEYIKMFHQKGFNKHLREIIKKKNGSLNLKYEM